jgi:membrane fusion protein (multidrug efflux system)
VLLVVAVAAGVVLLRYLSTFETTDDAQVDGNISAIGARIAGTVSAVYVEDNQRVAPADLLVELDPQDYEVALKQAEANLDQTRHEHAVQTPSVPITDVTNRTSIATAEKDVASARAEVAGAVRDQDAAVARLREAEANERIAHVDLERSAHLVEAGAVAQQDFDERRATADARAAAVTAAQAGVESSRERVTQARAKVAQAEARLAQAQENAPKQLDQTTANVMAHEASVDASQAALEQARLNLDYTRIVAPVAGIVGQKSVNVGDRVQPGQQLLAIVQTDTLWITANYNETQLRHMHPGQRADVRVDSLGRTFHGHVESLPGATGARFSLLPPENATGNFVKVVQRLPVRIRLDGDQEGLERLRPGMSVEPKVWVD